MDKKDFMLCEGITESELGTLDKSKWFANLKYDGERVVAIKLKDEIILLNRRGNIITNKFPEIVNELKWFNEDFIIDGEIISFDGIFNSLQKRALTKDASKREILLKQIPCKYEVFDIMKLENQILTYEPLSYRIEVLNKMFEKHPHNSPTITENGEGNDIISSKFTHLEVVEYGDIFVMLERCKENLGEGIIIKKMDSTYEGRRSRNWLKCKMFKEGYLTITAYEVNNAGIRATDNQDNAIQISGRQSDEVKKILDEKGYCDIQIQYLTQSEETGKYRFPSYRGLKEIKNE